MMLWKSQLAVIDCESCSLPFFSAHNTTGLTGFTIDYRLAAVVVHEGDTHPGHYRAMLRVDIQHPDVKCQWLLTDDNTSMGTVDDWPMWVAQTAVMPSFVRKDAASIPNFVMHQPAEVPWSLSEPRDILDIF